MVGAVPKNPAQPILWGEEGSGMSLDNLAPGFKKVAVIPSPQGNVIKWEVIDNDVIEFEVFKGVHELFEPVVEARIANLNAGAVEFTDTELPAGYEFFYIVSAKDKSGNISFSETTSGSIVSGAGSVETPAVFSLMQNYPNPFNPATTIEFSLPQAANITLKVYDMLGREVAEIAQGNFSPGRHKAEFNGASLPSGIYFYTLKAGEFSATKKLMLMK
jgi:hypothetical protein